MNYSRKLYEALKLQSFESFVYQTIYMEKLASSLESSIIFDESFSVIPVEFFIADFKLLSCELDLHLNCYTESPYINILLKQNKFKILLRFLKKFPKWFLLLHQE